MALLDKRQGCIESGIVANLFTVTRTNRLSIKEVAPLDFFASGNT